MDTVSFPRRFVRSEATFVVLATVAGVAAALLLGQLALVQFARMELRHSTGELLKYTKRVVDSAINTMDEAEISTESPCSVGDLDDLRYLAFHSDTIYDIGRVKDGHVLCTANWGRSRVPRKLPPPQRVEPNGVSLWANVPNVMNPLLVVDMAARGGVVLFTDPSAFAKYRRMGPEFKALVLTRDSRHLFRVFGSQEGLIERFQSGAPFAEFGPRLTESACDDELDICVVVAHDGVNVLTYAPWLGFEIGGVGAAVSFLLALLALRRRRKLSSLPEQIRRAVAYGLLRVAYQPLVRIRDESVIGVEALARLVDRGGISIPPDVFIAVAEQNGFISDVTRAVVRRALTDMRERLLAAPEFHVGINVSVCDLVDPGFQAFLDAETRRLGIPRDRIVIEMTERSATDEARLLASARRLRDQRYNLFIDDLGTGFSSLAYLSILPISGIKIDRIFTRAIGREAIGSAIVEKLCSMAEMMNVKLVVEGIERPEQASQILALCPEAIGQGYLWGRPVPPEQLPSGSLRRLHAHCAREPDAKECAAT
ncbi:EAL domain-containing protein [Paraburkholderia tropica]|uniref:EAL domain-containing protein n=1 Tax=Paraburkholderia tropica TaxID=92647 RepID=UPI002AB18460|nr:EAL domain-containing protein [Paraburkholderia tropica]